MDTNDTPLVAADESILAYVKRRLEEFKGQWPTIAAETGVPYGTINNIASGKSENPELASVQPLIDWFHARDEMREKLRRRA